MENLGEYLMKRTGTNRRAFLKTAATSTLFLSSASALSQSVDLASTSTVIANSETASAADLLETIKDSIQADFGSGFAVLSFSQKQGNTYVQIEHLENYYTVVSADFSDWKILQSSVS
ncbi:MAG: putative GNAT superfamily acetyltransferase [Arenicella sp.]|jgi:predicted GNAT superfamily acetyltransferase